MKLRWQSSYHEIIVARWLWGGEVLRRRRLTELMCQNRDLPALTVQIMHIKLIKVVMNNLTKVYIKIITKL